MPKRPCAIAITTDDQTIICADKFGDVYSLPLVPSLLDISNMGQAEEKYLTHSVAAKPFISAANDLTIHTARNRKALQNQMRQNQKLPEKTEPKFEHKLLLGHVSMLTDLVVAERQSRNYIITADRDEHIRVSRGIPQAHIIENYCLGHEDFITRLCLPTPFPELLLSGGGDDAIYVWDFLSGRVLFRGSLRPHVETLFPEGLREIDLHPGAEVDSEIESVKIAVSSIRFLDIGVSNHGFVVVICEGYVSLNPLTHFYYFRASLNFPMQYTGPISFLTRRERRNDTFTNPRSEWQSPRCGGRRSGEIDCLCGLSSQACLHKVNQKWQRPCSSFAKI
jgi:tRNA (guanine-N(7)-)-methyltransferase subunit TRM82